MKVSRFIIGVFFSASLAGCLKAPSESSQVACSSSYLSDSQKLEESLQKLKTMSDLSRDQREVEVLKAQLRCEKFFAKHTQDTCVAETTNTQGETEEKTIQSEGLRTMCEGLDEASSPKDESAGEIANSGEIQPSNPPPTPAPNPSVADPSPVPTQAAPKDSTQTAPETVTSKPPPTTTTTTLPVRKLGSETVIATLSEKQMQFEVLNPELIKKSTIKPPHVWVNGKFGPITDFAKEISDGQTYCVIDSDPETEFQLKKKMSLMGKAEESSEKEKRPLKKITFSLNDYKTMIGCAKLSLEPFRIKDVQASLIRVFEIHASH